ncbi:MAG: TM2 domain-containing protein [Defluviitaleaceae bacterium]|nr:TM2 domain-containing protein [Defluviitaleaceae bacterium]
MKCYNHNTIGAAGACVECKNLFCRECLVEFDDKYYCKDHALEKIKLCTQNDNGETVAKKKYNESKRNKKNKKKHKNFDFRWLISLVLCILWGYLGIHRFYLGRWGTGFLWLFTGGLFGIGYIVDIILIACGELD